jgi:hypothetical protein
MNNYYTINYSLLALLLTPTLLRNDVEKAFITSLAKPLDALNDDFNAYVQSLDTQVNAQTCYMQAMLNNEFDFTERRIEIRIAPVDFDSFLLWKENQNKPLMISGEKTDGFTPHLLSRAGLTGATNNDFEVVLPLLWIMSPVDLKRMKKIINGNKLASKQYRIIYE